MKELAALIRKGLESGVIEDKFSIGVFQPAEGDPTANIVGLALIGKIGLAEAQDLFDAAFHEGVGESTEEDGPASREIYEQLGITLPQSQFLVMMHFRMSAAQIAAAMEDETFQWDEESR